MTPLHSSIVLLNILKWFEFSNSNIVIYYWRFSEVCGFLDVPFLNLPGLSKYFFALKFNGFYLDVQDFSENFPLITQIKVWIEINQI